MVMVKNILIGIILFMIVTIMVLIGLEPVIIELCLSENPLEDDTQKIINIGVVSKTNSEDVRILNNNIYINDGGTYAVSGILYNGTIYIDTADDVTLNFDGVTIVNESYSVIDNRKSAKIIINLEKNSNNILSDGTISTSAIKSVGDIFLEGEGSMLIYGNSGNGITTSTGNLVINGNYLYIIAKGAAFDIADEFLINSSVVLGLGNGGMQPTSNLSKQNTLLFNFDSEFKEGTNFSLRNFKEENMINFVGIRDFKTLTLSLPSLEMGRYQLYQNIMCNSKIKNGIYQDCVTSTGDLINISITDTYIVNSKWNWYGAMDIIINYIPEITT